MIFCRHLVFTYFEEPLQREVLVPLASRLPHGGVLVTGKQEPFPADVAGFVPCAPRMGVYRRVEHGAPDAGDFFGTPG